MGILRRSVSALLLLTASAAIAQARFDLPGPKIDIRVTRAGIVLPIASVPNLQPGDKLWLHPDLPPSQSVHYLLIATFLRGTTNPPPDDWFIRIQTWDKNVREEGVTVTVPAEAQQAILFLAPETGGDFSTLRSAVKGRPGIFVRASADLAEAGFEQGRIEKYLDAMKQVPPGEPKALQEHSDLLARTLALKPNPDCFKRSLDQQYACLTQTGNQTLLDDGHAQSIAAALSTGPTSDFINAASYTSLAGAGTYSAYVGAIVDLVRLTSGLHTAKYQYIPAIVFPASNSASESLDLRLNTPPSFNNPKSVIVIGLPAVQKTVPPPLRPVDPNRVSCLLDPHVALPIQGAPLVFSTSFAHDLVLHLNTPTKREIPLTPDAFQGGLVLTQNTPTRKELLLNQTPGAPSQSASSIEVGTPNPTSEAAVTVTGTIQGMWGFDHFTGPTLPLQQSPGGAWKIVAIKSTPADPEFLIVGHANHLNLQATGTACIRSIALEPSDTKVDWKLATLDRDHKKSTAPADVEIGFTLPRDTPPGTMRLAIHQFGLKDPEFVSATAFVEPARVETLKLHAGDSSAILTGTGLDQVNSIFIKDLTYLPTKPRGAPSQSASSIEVGDLSGNTLTLSLPADAKSPTFHANEKLSAEVHLRDGRSVPISTLVLASRPTVTILSRRPSQLPTTSVQLGNAEDMVLGSQLTFFLKSTAPFPRAGSIEIATSQDASDALHTSLSVTSDSLVLQDAHTILATFDPLKTFGPSTYGPFRLRPVAPDGTTGDWIPLTTVVRLPTFTGLVCPVDATAECILSGSAIYLVDTIALDPDFATPTKVPEGFVDTAISIPHPTSQPVTIYLHLRDDPATTDQVSISIQTETPTAPAARRN